MRQWDISDIIEDIYVFQLSPQQVSIITDSVIKGLTKWHERALKKMYSFMFVKCLYVSIRTKFETKNLAVYYTVAYDLDGLPALGEDVKTIFPKAVLQRCIVHLVWNSIKYISSKNYKKFTANLKLIYKASKKSCIAGI